MSFNSSEYNDFLKNLNSLKEAAVLQGGFVTMEEIDEAFNDLNDEQKGFIKDYLTKNNIGIDKPLDSTEYMSEEDVNLYQIYLDSLEEVEVVSDSVKRVLMMEAINGVKESKDRLLQQFLQNVIDVAKLYTGQGVSLMDLIGEGNVALTIAMEELGCVEGPDDVEPLVMKMIMNSMEELIQTEGSSEDISSKVLNISEEVLEKAKELADELMRKVTIDELVKETGISRKRIKDALHFSKELYDLIEKEQDDE